MEDPNCILCYMVGLCYHGQKVYTHTMSKKCTLSDQGFMETEGCSGRTRGSGIAEIELLLAERKE